MQKPIPNLLNPNRFNCVQLAIITLGIAAAASHAQTNTQDKKIQAAPVKVNAASSGSAAGVGATGFGLRDGNSCGCFEASGGLIADDVVTDIEAVAAVLPVKPKSLVNKTQLRGAQ